MYIHARIREIEDSEYFKALFNRLMTAEFGDGFTVTKEWQDKGLDGYLVDEKKAFAVYCPKYSERSTQKQYIDKFKSDLKKLKVALDSGSLSFQIEKWCVLTPEELSTEVQSTLLEESEKCGLQFSSMCEYHLAALFVKYPSLHFEYPKLLAGLKMDKEPDVYLNYVNNRNYPAVEVFNSGTEAIYDLKVETSLDQVDWKDRTHDFLYTTDDPMKGYKHTCTTLLKGERQYVTGVMQGGGFYVRVSGVGAESKKHFSKIEQMEEGQI